MKADVCAFLFLFTLLTPAYTRAQSKKGEHPPQATEVCSRDIVPMSLRDGIILARLEINQKPMTFLVDTGGLTMINSDRLKLPIVTRLRTGTTTVTANDALEWWDVVEVRTLEVGRNEFREIKLPSRSLPQLEKLLRTEVDGILGADLLRRWDRVSLDYKDQRVVLERVHCGLPDTAALEFERAMALQHR